MASKAATTRRKSPAAKPKPASAVVSAAPLAAAAELDADDADELDAEAAAAPTIRTEGQRLLLAVPGTLELIGDSIGATRQAVLLWRQGARLPGPQWRRSIHERFGIPPEAWGRTPLAPGETLQPLRFDDGPGDGPEPSALDDVARLLRLLRRQLDQPGLLARERAQYADAFARALAQKERIERERAMLEDRTIREHPKWKRLRTAIIDALIPHPEAARDVEAAIARVLGQEDTDDASL
jgi:hypothetical protein